MVKARNTTNERPFQNVFVNHLFLQLFNSRYVSASSKPAEHWKP
jgi:hypothetical protein